MFIPSIKISPVGSAILNSAAIRELFPAPVLPTIPTCTVWHIINIAFSYNTISNRNYFRVKDWELGRLLYLMTYDADFRGGTYRNCKLKILYKLFQTVE